MRHFLLYSILLGMVLINTPKALLHDCTHEVHKCNHDHLDTDIDGQHQGNSFEIADCELCAYYFHSLDTPDSIVIPIPATSTYAPLAMRTLSASVCDMQNFQLRGPPIFVTI
jgi:hypothetical protein